MSVIAPRIPDTAPFSISQRNWLDGYIASLQGDRGGAQPASKPRERVTIIYASQSGNTEELAETFGEQLKTSGFDCPVICAEDYQSVDLVKEKTVLILSSTWGEGDPPDNAVDFWESLSSDDHPKLENTKFSVLGLGDTNYIDFCSMGKQFDTRLEELGATRFSPRVDCDTDYEEVAEAWLKAVMDELGAAESSDSSVEPKALSSTYSKKNPFPAQLLTNQKLNTLDSARDTRHFELSLEGSGLNYDVGDVIGIYPENDPDLVTEILQKLNLTATAEQENQLKADRDICTISEKLVEQWFSFCDTTPSITAEEIKTYTEDHQLIDLVEDFPASFDSVDTMIPLLRKMGARLYSISSSPKAHPDQVHLTIARVAYETHSKQRKGVCSTYLSDRVQETDRVRVFYQAVKHFKLPGDSNIPVIMVGPGTGIAPFRAFLEEREATQSPGGNWLFFGNPHEDTDWLYRDQIEAWVSNGVLSNFHAAWSRDTEAKVYVQDRITENGEELWRWIDQDRAHFYVCGDAKRMAKDVDQALQGLVATHGGMTPGQAADYVAAMKKEKRYQRDVY